MSLLGRLGPPGRTTTDRGGELTMRTSRSLRLLGAAAGGLSPIAPDAAHPAAVGHGTGDNPDGRMSRAAPVCGGNVLDRTKRY